MDSRASNRFVDLAAVIFVVSGCAGARAIRPAPSTRAPSASTSVPVGKPSVERQTTANGEGDKIPGDEAGAARQRDSGDESPEHPVRVETTTDSGGTAEQEAQRDGPSSKAGLPYVPALPDKVGSLSLWVKRCDERIRPPNGGSRRFQVLTRPGGVIVWTWVRFNCADRVTFKSARLVGHRLVVRVHTPRGGVLRARCMCTVRVQLVARLEPGTYEVDFKQIGGLSFGFHRRFEVGAK